MERFGDDSSDSDFMVTDIVEVNVQGLVNVPFWEILDSTRKSICWRL